MIERNNREIELYIPLLAEKAETIEKISMSEYIIKTYDGDVYLYDSFDKTYRELPSSSSMEEDRFKIEFGRRLKRLMYVKGFTQMDISDLTGLSQPQISSYMRGKTLPSIYIADKLARALNCNIDDFVYHY